MSTGRRPRRAKKDGRSGRGALPTFHHPGHARSKARATRTCIAFSARVCSSAGNFLQNSFSRGALAARADNARRATGRPAPATIYSRLSMLSGIPYPQPAPAPTSPRRRNRKSRWRDLNPQPRLYESRALPLSYIGVVTYRKPPKDKVGAASQRIKDPAAISVPVSPADKPDGPASRGVPPPPRHQSREKQKSTIANPLPSRTVP